MKHTAYLLSSLAAALLVGCDKPETTTLPPATAPANPVVTAPEIRDYTYAQRAEFAAAMEAQRTEIIRDLEKLEAKVEKSSDAVKAEAKPRLEALREQIARLNMQLEGVSGATESTWESVKAGSKKAFDEMKDGFTQARQWLSEKIAP